MFLGDFMASLYRISFLALVGLSSAASVHAAFPQLELPPRVISEEIVQPNYPNSNAIAFDAGEAALYPAVSLRLGSNDNVFTEVDQTEATESANLTLSPRVDYIASNAKQMLWVGYIGDYGQFTEASQADYQNHRLSLISHTDFDSRRRLDLEASVMQSHQPIGTGRTINFTGAEIDAVTEVDTFQISKLGAAFSYGNPDVKGELVGGLGGGSINFTSNEADTAQYDRDFSIVWSQLYYRLSPRMRVVGGLAQRQSDYERPYSDDGRERDSTTTTVSVGFIRELSDLWFGQMSIRGRSQDFDDARLEDNDGVLLNAELTWLWRSYSRIKIRLAEEKFESVVGDGVAQLSSIGLTWQHTWSDRFATEIQLASFQRDESDPSLNNDYSQSRVELRFAPRRWFRVLGGYTGRTVGRSTGDAQRTEIYVGVEANL